MSVLTFPLTLPQFFDLLPIGAVRFNPTEAHEQSETAGGEILTADLGTALWSGEVDLSILTHQEAAAITPLINLLRRAGASFLIADATRPWPRLDPKGLILGASVPVIAQIGASGRELAIGGLPPGYPLSRGDLVSFTYGANPVRYGLHEIIEAGVANGAGVTPLLEVGPPVRPGAAVAAPVQLLQARYKAKLSPGSADTGQSRHTITSGAKFAWSQTLR